MFLPPLGEAGRRCLRLPKALELEPDFPSQEVSGEHGRGLGGLAVSHAPLLFLTLVGSWASHSHHFSGPSG